MRKMEKRGKNLLKNIAGINQNQTQDMEGSPVWNFCRMNGKPTETKCRRSICIQSSLYELL